MSESPLRPSNSPSSPHSPRDIQAEIRRSIENSFSRLREHKDGLAFFLNDIRRDGANSLTPQMVTWLRGSSKNYRNLFKENRDSASGKPKPSNMEKLDHADFPETDRLDTEISLLRDEIYAIYASASPQNEQVRGLAQEVLEILKIEGEEVPLVASPFVADPGETASVEVAAESAVNVPQSPEAAAKAKVPQDPVQEAAGEAESITLEIAKEKEEEAALPAWTSGEIISGLEFVSSNGDFIFQVSKDVASYSTLVTDVFLSTEGLLLPDETVRKLEAFLDAVHEQGAPLLPGDGGRAVVDNVETVLLENEKRNKGKSEVSAVQQVENAKVVTEVDIPIQLEKAEPLVATVLPLANEAEPTASLQKSLFPEEGFLNATREVDFTRMTDEDVQNALESIPYIDGEKGISPKLYALLIAIAERLNDFDEAFYDASRSRELLGEISVFSKMVADNYSQELSKARKALADKGELSKTRKALADNGESSQLAKNLYVAMRKIEERLLEAARWEVAEDDVTPEVSGVLLEQQEVAGALTQEGVGEGALGALPFQVANNGKGGGDFQDTRPAFANTQPAFGAASSSPLVLIANSRQKGGVSPGQSGGELPQNPLLEYAVQSNEETQLLPLEVSEQETVEWARERVHTLASIGGDLIFNKNTLTDIEKINELLVVAERNGNEAVTLLQQDTFFKENLLHLREMVEKRLRDLEATFSSGILSGEERENAEVIKKSLNFLCKFFGLENEVPAETVQAILGEGGDSEIQVISKPSEALAVITQAGQVVEDKKETPVLFFDILGKIGSNQEITAEDREIAFNALSDIRSSPENYYQIFKDQATFSKLERYLSENEARYIEEKKKYDSNDRSVDRDDRDFFYFYTSLSDVYKEFLKMKVMAEEGLANASEQSPAEAVHLHISNLGEGRFVPPAPETLRVKGGRMLLRAKAWAAARIPGIQKALTLKQETKDKMKVTLLGAIASVKESVSMVRDPSIVKKMIQESRKDLEEAVTMAEVNESDILSGAAPFRLRPEGEQNPEATKARATLLEKFKKGVDWYDKLPKLAKYSASVALIGLGIAGTVTGAPVIAGAAVAGRVVLRAASAASLGMGTAAAMRAQNKEGNTFSKFAHNNAAAIGMTAGLVAFFAGNYSEFMRWNLLDIAPHLPQPEISLSVPVSEIPVLLPIDIPNVLVNIPIELGDTAVRILSDISNGGLQGVLGEQFSSFQELTVEAKKKFIENLLANIPKDSISELGVAAGDFTHMIPGQDSFKFDKLAEIAKNTVLMIKGEKTNLIERAFQVAAMIK